MKIIPHRLAISAPLLVANAALSAGYFGALSGFSFWFAISALIAAALAVALSFESNS